MKILKLSLQNIKKLATTSKFYFFMIVFGISISMLGILFYSGYLLYSYYGSTGENKVIISISMKDNASVNEIHNVIDNLFAIDDNKVAQLTVAEQAIEPINGTYQLDELPIVGEYRLGNDKSLLLGSYLEKEENDTFVVLSEELMKSIPGQETPLNQVITLDGVEFLVKGISSMVDYYCIPVNYFIENYNTNVIYGIFPKELSKTSREKLNYTLASNHWIENYVIPEPYNPFLSVDFLSTFLQVVIIFCLSIINIFTMLCFWIKRLKKTYSIYAICGCSSRKQSLIILFQILIVSFGSILVGTLLFFIMLPVFINIKLVAAGAYINYFIVMFIMLFITAIFSLRLVWGIIKENKVYQVKEKGI